MGSMLRLYALGLLRLTGYLFLQIIQNLVNNLFHFWYMF